MLQTAVAVIVHPPDLHYEIVNRAVEWRRVQLPVKDRLGAFIHRGVEHSLSELLDQHEILLVAHASRTVPTSIPRQSFIGHNAQRIGQRAARAFITDARARLSGWRIGSAALTTARCDQAGDIKTPNKSPRPHIEADTGGDRIKLLDEFWDIRPTGRPSSVYRYECDSQVVAYPTVCCRHPTSREPCSTHIRLSANSLGEDSEIEVIG